MYHIRGSQEIVKSCNLLIRATSPVTQRLTSSQDFRNALFQALAHHDVAPPGELGATPAFVENGAFLTELVALFPFDPLLDELGPANPARRKKVAEGWTFLRKSDAHLAALLQLVVHDYFTTAAKRSGSMSDRSVVGSLWIAPAANWTIEECAEAFLHEATHTFLFVDELAYGHFVAGADQVRVLSSIRRDDREMPAALHSALVGVELYQWRKRNNIEDAAVERLHGSSERLAHGAADVLDKILGTQDIHDLLTPRMRGIAATALESLGSAPVSAAR